MIGLNRNSGHAIGDLAQLRQSIADILTTPIGSRVMRRDYGSHLPELIDQPFNDATRMRAYAASAMALMRWEWRLQLTRIQIAQGDVVGTGVIDIEGVRRDTGEALSLQVPLQLGAVG